MQPLLNTACICLMPDHLAYHWWSAPSAVGHSRASPPEPQEVQGGGAAPAASPLAVPGQVEVKGVSASTLGHNSSGSSSAQAGQTSLVPQDPAPSTHPLGAASTHPAGGPSTHPRAAPSPSEGAQATTSGAGAARAEAWEEEGAGRGTDSDGGPFVCSPVHVQLQVLHSLRRLLTCKLDAIAGGTPEEDRSLAQQPESSPAAGMALRYRAGQKQIAAAALAALASTAAGVVQRAVARLGLGLRQASTPGEVRSPTAAVCC